jgi:hypothetical protein
MGIKSKSKLQFTKNPVSMPLYFLPMVANKEGFESGTTYSGMNVSLTQQGKNQ